MTKVVSETRTARHEAQQGVHRYFRRHREESLAAAKGFLPTGYGVRGEPHMAEESRIRWGSGGRIRIHEQ